MQQETIAMINRHLRIASRALRRAIFVVVVPGITIASMTMITLPDLVKKSTTIAYGHIDASSISTGSGTSPAVVTFDVVRALKGAAVPGDRLSLCNSHLNSERPDLSKQTGPLVMFASPRDSCLDLAHGSRSAITFAKGRAQTYMLEGEPHDQSFAEFVHKIQSFETKQNQSH